MKRFADARGQDLVLAVTEAGGNPEAMPPVHLTLLPAKASADARVSFHPVEVCGKVRRAPEEALQRRVLPILLKKDGQRVQASKSFSKIMDARDRQAAPLAGKDRVGIEPPEKAFASEL